MNDSLPEIALPPMAALPAPLQARAQGWVRRFWPSLVFLWLPTALVAFYYFVIASDLYASEARFIVRSPSRQQMGGLSGLLQLNGLGGGGGQTDAYSVQDFILSRDGLRAVQKHLDLRAIFGRPDADFVTRFPNWVDRDNEEDFFRYYQRRVSVISDTTTGISTLEVQAFRAEDAHKLAAVLLDEGEALVNRLNERARSNAVQDAETDVKLAEARTEKIQNDLLAYRSRENLLDPVKSSGATVELVSRMQAELSATRTRLAEITRNSPGSPLRAGLEEHATALERQISTERARLTGGDGSMAPKVAEYQQLILQQEFAAKELTSVMASLENARADARRQQLYLDRVVAPNLPDKALYPRRIRTVAVVFFSLFMLYAIGRLLVAGVREHAQM